ncbi:MAG: 50S ribosomal protein L11 methyltransferase, partial [SAR202 cluster bacterium]|nr:50S ribosomal protein L11 methyltransferase [SAR202 cluster bacterium]
MKWVEFSVQTPSEFVEPISEIFHRYGQGGVAIDAPGGFNPDEGEQPLPNPLVTVRAYAPVDQRLNDRRSRIQVGVMLVSQLAPVSPLKEREMEEEEWQDAWKKHFHVLHVGRRIVIVPTWRQHKPGKSEVVIRLDPGMAFGTGHHPTTRMCLEALEQLVRPGMAVLDVGCGSAILSVAAARLGAARVLGLEIEPVAAQTGLRNAALNEASETVTVLEGSLPNPAAAPAFYDIVAANISAKVIIGLADEMAAVAKPGGMLLASGILTERMDEVRGRLDAAGFEIENVQVDGDWVALTAR